MNVALSMNTHNMSYLTNNYPYGQVQQPSQPSFSYPAIMSGAHSSQARIANNGYGGMIAVSQQQSEISKAYQMKQEQLWISHQRNVEEMNHMNSYPHIRHHCVITDRLDREDSRYTNFTKQVEKNERFFEAADDTFDDKNYIAQKMNAQRLSILGAESTNLSRNSSRESFVRDNCECGEDSDEERPNNVSDYVSTPSTSSSVSNEDSLPSCSPGDTTTSAVASEKHVMDERRVTCLSLLGETCENDSDQMNANECLDNESFVVDYALINRELEMIEKNELVKQYATVQHSSADIIPTVLPLPVQVQIPVSIDPSMPWINATFALPVPMVHFPFQNYIPSNVGMDKAFNINVVNSNNYYFNEQLGYFA